MTTTTTTTRSTTSTTTTATEAIETQNEVIRSRSRSPNSDRGGRVKIRVRQKKRPFTTTAIPTTTFTKTLPQFAASTTSISNTLSGSPARTLIRRLRPVSFTVPPLLPEPQPILDTKFEVRTETSVRTATSKSIVMQSNNALFAKRNGLLFNNNTTKDSNIDNNNSESKSKSLVILRGFCRKAPMESENPHCFRAEALYFYNVTSASCEAFYKGHCARSRNKFNSVQECQDKCIINNSKSLSSISNPISKSKIIFDRPL